MAERMIQSAKQVMRCLLQEKKIEQSHWPSLLTEVSFTMNSMTNATTKVAPQELFFGNKLRSPTEAQICIDKLERIDSDDQKVSDLVKDISMKIHDFSEIAKKTADEAHLRMKVQYDKGTKESTVVPGDYVLLNDKCRKSGLDNPFTGPYIVTQRRGPNVEIEFTNRVGKISRKWVHLNRCKIFKSKPDHFPDMPTVFYPTRCDIYPETESVTVHEPIRQSTRSHNAPVRFGIDEFG